MKRSVVSLLVLVLISTPVHAENNLFLVLPGDTGGDNYILTERLTGEIKEGRIDETGQLSLEIAPEGNYELVVNSRNLKSVVEEDEPEREGWLSLPWLFALTVFSAVFYLLGQWRSRKIMSEIKRIVYDENLD